ncbi:hypothetical protein COLO4_21575 [Corchorus olitorius]|uniref:Protein kinase domain-containing protein n=1 Tax=Corchorus olitorius TaxID=93759 RepID=A0A1R3ISK7_9ROSI|nr:hypothetical protein COLO4_21575 [Corchorus olitorius]
MQLPDSSDIVETLPENPESTPNQQKDENDNDDNGPNGTVVTTTVDGDAESSNKRSSGSTDEDLVLDVSGKSVEFSILGDSTESVDGLYLYKNVFNLIPKSVGTYGRLRNLKFFSNRINLFPAEVGSLAGLECLQVKISSPEFNGMALSKLKGLKELELSRVPPRASVLTLLSEIAGLKCLTKLSVCYFSIRLTSLGSLELSLMRNLQTLNLQDCDGSVSYNGNLTVPLSSSRCFATRRSSKRWKRRHYLQQRARQERLNSSRKWKGEGHAEVLTIKASRDAPGNNDVLTSDTGAEVESEVVGVDDDKTLLLSEAKDEKLSSVGHEDDTQTSKNGFYVKNKASVGHESLNKGSDDESSQLDASPAPVREGAVEHDEGSSSEICKSNFKSKRHSERDLSNPKPCKSRKPTDNCFTLSQKYSATSFCGIEDHLPDGFYDAGRDRPFMQLSSYEQIFHLDSREVILVDRERDEELDAITLSAQALVFHLKHLNGLAEDREWVPVDNLQIASLLALFVSDHFGGSDRSGIVERTRKAVSGSNYKKPFICTCSTGNGDNASAANKTSDTVEDIVFSDLCERSLRSIKSRRNSIVVPIGTLQFGVCRHRALLMKYLCDRMEPPVPCELVRGYLDFMPHAWNVVLVKRGDSWVRMVVDACHPHDIREETDPEYFCRYIPLSRAKASFTTEGSSGFSCSFPSMTISDEIEVASSSLMRCKIGSMEAAAKVRTLEVFGASFDETHIEKLAQTGEKHVPVDLALCIARDVASALVKLHSEHIIHRDIKSENILIDLNEKRVDGSPIVKLCDFDRAVPLRSFLHTCCIAHVGIPPPDVCVGTPRWMAPEVLRAMHKPNQYGLEVDIWSFGCLLYELLTLQVPYIGLSEMHIHELLQMGKRPRLTDELEALESLRESTMTQSGTEFDGTEGEKETLRFLIDVFRRCTEENPSDRPTAEELYNMLLEHTNDFRNSS